MNGSPVLLDQDMEFFPAYQGNRLRTGKAWRPNTDTLLRHVKAIHSYYEYLMNLHFVSGNPGDHYVTT